MVLEFLNKLVFTVFKAIIDFISQLILKPVINFVVKFLVGMISYYMYQLSVLLLSAIDLISDFFQMLAGIEMATGSYISFGDDLINGVTGGRANAAGGDMLFQLLVSEPVLKTFTSVLAVGLFLTVLSTLIMIVKQEFNTDKPNAKGPIIASALKSFIYMIFVPVICIFGVYVSNLVLNLIHTATSGDNDITISGVVFTSAAYNARYRAGEAWVSLDDPISGAIASGLNALVESIVGVFGISGEDLEYSSAEAVAVGEEIRDRYIYISKHKEPLSGASMCQIMIYVDGSNKTVFTAKDAAKILKKYDSSINPDEYTTMQKLEDLLEDSEQNSGKFIKCDTKAEAKALSKNTYSASGGVSSAGKIAVYWTGGAFRAYFNTIQVSKDYNASRINYVSLIASAIIIIKAMAQACVGFIMRLYKAVAFFLILPGVLGLSPLDGGASFSSWRKTFVGEVIAGYGFILAVNIYLLITPIVASVDIDYKPTNAPSYWGGLSSGAVSAMAMIGPGMAEGIIRMVFIIAGALMIEKLASMISGFIGGVDLASVGKGMLSDMAKTTASAAMIGGGIAMGGLATTALMYGAIGDKLQTGTKGAGAAFKSNFKKELDKGKGFGKVGRAITGTVSGSFGALKKTGSNVGQGLKSVPKNIASKAKEIKDNGVHGNLLNIAAPFSKTAQSMKFARSNYLESKGKFEDAGKQVDIAQAEYDEAVKGGNQEAIDAAGLKLNQAKAEHQNLAKKYIDDANKYEGTAAALRDGNLENAKAAGLFAMSTVLDNLPGADIAKGLWSSRKDAAKEVDDSSEYNKDRAETLNKAAKDLRDKLASTVDPVGRAHNQRGININAMSMMADVQTKLQQSYTEKMEQLTRFTELLKSAGDDAARRASIMIYIDIAQDISVARTNAGNNSRLLMQNIEKVMKKYADAAAKPVFKDVMDVLEQIKNSKQ